MLKVGKFGGSSLADASRFLRVRQIVTDDVARRVVVVSAPLEVQRTRVLARPGLYLEDLFVASDARGGGVGRALIGHVTDWARERGLSKVYWQTAADNATARALYDSLATTEFFVYETALD